MYIKINCKSKQAIILIFGECVNDKKLSVDGKNKKREKKRGNGGREVGFLC